MTIARIANAKGVSVDALVAQTANMDTSGANFIATAIAHVPTSAAVTDAKGNTYSALTDYGTNPTVTIWYTAGSITVGTGHWVKIVSQFPSLCVAAYSGVASSPLDQSIGASATQPGSLTPSEDNCLVWEAACAAGDGGLGLSAGATQIDSQDGVYGLAYSSGSGESLQTTATAINPTWGYGNVVRSAQAIFKSAAVSAVVAARGSTLLMMGVG